jgi:hypothetical protein
MSDELDRLALNIQNKKASFYGFVPHGPVVVSKIEDVTSITWYRKGNFQVQLFAVPPNYIIPEHTHPNVDSYELHVGGDISFSKNGVWVDDTSAILPKNKYSDGHPDRGTLVRVKPTTPHGGAFGPRGGVFMSIQEWINGEKPHCVSADYDGVVMGQHHLDGVVKGEAVSKGQQGKLTWRDAATKEDRPPEFEAIKK